MTQRNGTRPNIVAIGASAGGVEALVRLASLLPAQLPVSIFVVLHVSPISRSVLPLILSNAGPIIAEHPKDGERIQKGRIYVAPPNYHMIIDSGAIKLDVGPKENRHRPAIDPLFRSAAMQYGKRVIGVVLTGGLDDGALGLWEIKRSGGVAIVQDPAQAAHPSMPLNALRRVDPDFVLPVEEIPPILARLTGGPVAAERS